jgi:hypothetical protein
MHTRDQIVAALHAAGVTDEDQIQKALNAAEPTVAGDDLSKSLDDLRGAFDREHGERDEDLAKSLEESVDLVAAVTAGADNILSETRAQNDAMAKGMVALINETKAMRAEVRGLNERIGDLEGASEDIAKAMDVPVEPRGLSGAQPLPAPAEQTPAGGNAVTSEGLIAKALSLMPEADNNRKRVLSTAISRLNSGFAAGEVAKEFGLTG